ncbi:MULTISPECIES: FeoA family protein [Sulfurovum]|uniref:FeoA family protein n=1 Tax=Sulfurovum xiamenensis TaxID=3019066 RepID=A0ABT7QSU7_9BACT|nr:MULTISPECIES: FeoA family protein [Sulfurovum]EIF50456.1 ferrous iron transport protein A [Sulfurovum sp. AR]MDM5264080.1 FeoA family protein [Sulfurovum xiamenensis]
MVLSELHKGDKAEIIKVHADKALKDRLTSFGVMRGETLFVKGCSIAKQTMEIEVGSTLIALRADEAGKIEVEQIEN